MNKIAERRFDKRRDNILRVAVDIINRVGVKGLTINEIARELDVVPTAVAYYFNRKEDIGEACLIIASETIRDVVEEACAAPPDLRVGAFYRGYFTLQAKIIRKERPAIALMNDILAMRGNAAFKAYIDLVGTIRSLLVEDPPADLLSSRLRYAAAAQIMTQADWATIWLNRYGVGDFEWAARQLSDIVMNGFATAAGNDPQINIPAEVTPQQGGEVNLDMLLSAATRLINDYGYKGARVNEIAAELNVTKGSFYHHIDRKSDLLTACFNRTMDIIEQECECARTGENGLDRIWKIVAKLASKQLTGAVPLLELATLKSIPAHEQPAVMSRVDRLLSHLSTLIVDGIADGSIRPVDPHIGAQMILELVSSAERLPAWSPKIGFRERFSFIANVLHRGVRTLDL